jgi:hypothetical protein
MSVGLPDEAFTRILTETPEGQHVLKAFFDSWNQSHETDIIKKFQIALNKAYFEAQEPRNKRIDIILSISLMDSFNLFERIIR